MKTLEDGFKEFFANMGNKDILKAEYLLPIYIDELLQAGKVSVKVLDTNDKWFGVTYKEDKDYVVKSFAKVCDVASSAYLPHSGKSRLGCEAGTVMKFVFIPFVYCWRAGSD